MRAVILLVILGLAAGAVAQEPKPGAADPDKSFFRAYYLEHGLRDFAGAEAAYAEAVRAAADASRQELLADALISQADCLVKLGRPNDAKPLLERVLALDPSNSLAKQKLARMDLAPKSDEDAKIAKDVELLAAGVPASEEAKKRLLALGPEALPQLARGLRRLDRARLSWIVSFLAGQDDDAAWRVLRDALDDPAVQHPEDIADMMTATAGSAPASRKLDFVEAALRHAEPGVRQEAVEFLMRGDPSPYQGAALAPRLEAALKQALALDDPFITQRLLRWGGPPRNAWPMLFAAADRLLRAPPNDALLVAGFWFLDIAARHDDPSAAPSGFWERALDVATRHLDDRDPEVALEAMQALGRIRQLPWPEATAEAAHRAAVRLAENGPVPQTAKLRSISGAGPHALVAIHVPTEPWPRQSLSSQQLADLFERLSRKSAPFDQSSLSQLRNRVIKKLESMDLATDAAWPGLAASTGRALESPTAIREWLKLLQETKTAPLPWLVALANDDEQGIRFPAYQTLLASDMPPPAGMTFTHLARDLSEDWDAMRRVALGVAAWAPSPDLVPVLREGVVKNRLPIDETLQLLITIQGEGAMDFVLEHLPRTQIQQSVLKRAREKLGPAAIPWLDKAASAGSTFAAILALAETGADAEILEAFARRHLDSNWYHRNWSILGERLPADRYRALVLDALQKPAGEPRDSAIDAAKDRHLVEAWPLLVPMLDDPTVQNDAKQAMESIRSYSELKRGFEGLDQGARATAVAEATKLLKSDDPAQRRGAAYALAALKDAGAVPGLLQLLKDGDASVRQAAVEALDRLSSRAPAGK